MKKLLMLLVLAGSMPLASMAQDDVYFTPSKVESKSAADEKPAYYCGSNRNVDEYNRYGRLNSYYQKIGSDSLGNDIITFRPGRGVYPDTSYVDTAYVYPGSAKFDQDYTYTRRMSRWDGFYDPWFYDYYGPYGWYSPWYYGSWYGGWYDPWYYGYAGWYNPWYYGYGWGWPYYGYGWYNLWWPSYYNDYRYTGGHAGTANHWAYGGRSASGNFSGYRGGTNNAGTNNARSYSVRNNSRFESNRSYSDFNRVPSNRSYSTPSSSFGGGFSGGTRGGGFSGGGSRGSGSFGGRR